MKKAMERVLENRSEIRDDHVSYFGEENKKNNKSLSSSQEPNFCISWKRSLFSKIYLKNSE